MKEMVTDTIIMCYMVYWHGRMIQRTSTIRYHRICLQTFLITAIGWRKDSNHTFKLRLSSFTHVLALIISSLQFEFL